jgi:hypothetical protein
MNDKLGGMWKEAVKSTFRITIGESNEENYENIQ